MAALFCASGNHPLQHPHVEPGYQSPLAIKVKKAVGDKLAVGVVGMIDNANVSGCRIKFDGVSKEEAYISR